MTTVKRWKLPPWTHASDPIEVVAAADYDDLAATHQRIGIAQVQAEASYLERIQALEVEVRQWRVLVNQDPDKPFEGAK
jgi:hypothetical protein